jgi:hypothetical protein
MHEVSLRPCPSRRAEAGSSCAPGSIPRRRFLGVSAGVASGLIGLRGLSTRGAEVPQASASGPTACPLAEGIIVGHVNVALFESCLDESFVFRNSDGRTHHLELVEATADEPRPGLAASGIREDPFAVVFRAPANADLGQRVYRVEHPKLGALDVFAAPIRLRKSNDPILLQAVFG